MRILYKRYCDRKRINGFTLVELLAVLVILAIVLSITVPSISGMIDSSRKNAFESSVKLFIKTIDYQKLANSNFDPTTITKENMEELLGLPSSNYENVNVSIEDGSIIVTLVGNENWNGLIACGDYHNMQVVASTSECRTDLISPVITILGDNPTNILLDGIYSDAGATAIDDQDGDISDRIIVTGTINPHIPGDYNITYSVSDSAGNTTTATRKVTVIDNLGPAISFDPNGNENYAKTYNTTITANDVGGLLPDSLKYVWTTSATEPDASLFVNTFEDNEVVNTPDGVSGSYYLWVRGSDMSLNSSVSRSGIFNLDNEKPVISLNGDIDVTISVGEVYSDPGATVTDNIDTNINIITSGMINPSIVGTYSITYDASDDALNAADTVTRTVNVVDRAAPVITINGSNPVTLEIGTPYSDAGATAIDDVDGNVTSKIITTGTVNPSILGSYSVTYSVTDTAGNTSTAIRTINVVDTTAPLMSNVLAGSMIYLDPTFASGVNNMAVYNNSGNGTVVHNRITMSTPTGSGYGVRITVNGSASPGLGGYVHFTNSRANAVYFHRIIARIPVGYTIDRASNQVGNEASHIWITSQAGTGDWQEYIYITRAGSTGTFASFGHVYINGPSATAGNPVTWDIAYSTIHDTAYWGTSNNITFLATDAGSGVVAYGINQSSTTPPTFTNVTKTNSLGTFIPNITNNGTYYVWVKDAAGNTSKSSVVVSYVDRLAPTVTANAASYSITEGASNLLPGSYFTIGQNGSAPISTTVCVDTSNGNATVTNTSSLAAGTHVIRCTSTKANSLSANATTTLTVNAAYTCSTGTLTYDVSKGGYICVASNYNWSPSYYQRCPDGSTTVASWYPVSCYAGSGTQVCPCSSFNSPSYSYSDTDISADNSTRCSGNTKVVCTYGGSAIYPNKYYCAHYACGSMTSYISCPSGYSYNSLSGYCEGTATLLYQGESSYYCPSGWSTYSGSGSNLKCYKAATS